jgi:DNA-binding MarR family transcriptional regulator
MTIECYARRSGVVKGGATETARYSSRNNKVNGDERGAVPIGSGFGYLVRRAHRAFVKAITVSLAEHGLSLGQYQILRALLTKDGISQSELSDRLEVHKAALTALIDGLERDGYIKRRRPESDGRKLIVFLTAKGRNLQQGLQELARDINVKSQQKIAKGDMEVTVRVIDQIVANLQQMFDD